MNVSIHPVALRGRSNSQTPFNLITPLIKGGGTG